MSDESTILTAVRRSERALCEQVSQWESLEFGVAHFNPALPDSVDANQLREVWLAEIDGETALARAEEYFAERGARCLAWTTASGQALEPVEAVLRSKGWKRIDSPALVLGNWSILDQPADASVRVLPARAMPKAFRATFTDSKSDVAIERLNDPNYDCFVAMIEGAPAGRIAYLQAGDIARLHDLFVMDAHQEGGAATSLVHHVLQLARRLLPKAIVASLDPNQRDEISFLEQCGFVSAGATIRFQRPR